MRIIGGQARGRRLFSPDGMETRPTSDKTRESLFNILSFDIPDARVLDLFGGTGALALESLSRGAAYAVVSDKSPAAIKMIHKNADVVLGGEKEKRIRIIAADYKKALSALRGQKFSIVFLDPPYRLLEGYTDSIKMLLDEDMLCEEALIVLERDKSVALAIDARAEVFDTRLYRDTAVDFIRRRCVI